MTMYTALTKLGNVSCQNVLTIRIFLADFAFCYYFKILFNNYYLVEWIKGKLYKYSGDLSGTS